MRTFVSNDQAYNIVDTTQRKDPVMVILRATDATPIYWSQDRADLESNIDAGGNPQAGMLLLNTDPPLVLVGAKIIVWARSTSATKIECQIVSQRIGIISSPEDVTTSPGSAAPKKPAPVTGVHLPGFENSWSRKGGVQ